MKKMFFLLLFSLVLFCGCSWNNQSTLQKDEQNTIGDLNSANDPNNINEAVQKQVLYPANNYMGNSFLAENDRYIAYTNHDQSYVGVYLYDKTEKTTVKIYDNYAHYLVVGTNGVYFCDAGSLKKVDFSGANLKEIVHHVNTLTAYGQKIYYSSNDNNLYQLDMETDSVKLIVQGEKVFTETGMLKQFQNLCIGDRIYFSSSIDKNGERIAVLMGLDSHGSVSIIHECISLVNIAVYDKGFLYFEDENGLARVKADGNGLEERLLSKNADKESCDNFYVYNGKWYYQKYTQDSSRLICMDSADEDERILLDLSSSEFGQICSINQTTDYIFIIMTDPKAKENYYNYIVWVLDRNNYTAWRIGENFKYE